MKIEVYQVDAFASEVFRGNPAMVCKLDKWLDSDIMQKIAIENNLSETAFFIKDGEEYFLKWFTPEREIELCVHATLATAFVIFNHYDKEIKEISFNTLSGNLKVYKKFNKIAMHFPKIEVEKIESTKGLENGLGFTPIEVYDGDPLMVVLENEEDVKRIKPSMEILSSIGKEAIVVTAEGKDCDFVSRFFIPESVISEDPVTGSAHCILAPYWGRKLNKTKMKAKQLSNRGGELICNLLDEKVEIIGEGVEFLHGYIEI